MEYSLRSLPLTDILGVARQKDEMFIAKFARTMAGGTVVSNFKIIPHEDPEQAGKRYRIVRTEETGPISTTKKPQEERIKGKGPDGYLHPRQSLRSTSKSKVVEEDTIIVYTD